MTGERGDPGVGDNASEYFGGMVEEYDSLIRRAVPHYDLLLEQLVRYIPHSERILELGCGTGNITLLLAERFPRAVITVVDASQEMLGVTEARLGDLYPGQDRFHFVTGFFEEVVFAEGSFDLVASGQALHHVPDKLPLYQRIFVWLLPGGSLRFSDQILGNSDFNSAVNWERWLEYCRRPGNVSAEELESLVTHSQEHDHYEPLAAHFSYLEQSGFSSPDCLWRDGLWGIIAGDRPPASSGD